MVEEKKFSLKESIEAQIQRVLVRGQRFQRFDQIRQRHFWSSYLFAPGAGQVIPAGAYDIFKSVPGYIGQGYPVPLTTRETNWLGTGRVPDNQNFVISEVGVTVKRPPATPQLVTETEITHQPGSPFTNAPPNGIAAALTPTLINGLAPVHPQDAQAMLYGTILEMSFLTNNVPLGLCADFSQSGGLYAFSSTPYFLPSLSASWMGNEVDADTYTPGGSFPAGDPVNGIPAAAFRRRLEIPILLQHGEQMGMRLNIPRGILLQSLANGGSGWLELRVDWWATESFTELS